MAVFIRAIGVFVVASAAVLFQTAPAMSEQELLKEGSPTYAQERFASVRSLMFSNAEEAVEVLESLEPAVATGEIPELEWSLFYNYSVYSVDTSRGKYSRNLRRAISKYEKSNLPRSCEYGRILSRYSYDIVHALELVLAEKLAARAEQVLTSACPGKLNQIAKAILASGIVHLAQEKQFKSTIMDAHKEFTRARNLFPPSDQSYSRGSIYLRAIAWQAAAAGHFAPKATKKEELSALSKSFVMDAQLQDVDKAACNIQWDVRPRSYVHINADWAENLIKYDSPSGFVVAVTVGPEGIITDFEVLATGVKRRWQHREYSSPKLYKKTIARELKRWRVDINTETWSGCLDRQFIVLAGYEQPVEGDSRPFQDP